jgi:hypothetical protein
MRQSANFSAHEKLAVSLSAPPCTETFYRLTRPAHEKMKVMMGVRNFAKGR